MLNFGKWREQKILDSCGLNLDGVMEVVPSFPLVSSFFYFSSSLFFFSFFSFLCPLFSFAAFPGNLFSWSI
jgi:hypothetical protein